MTSTLVLILGLFLTARSWDDLRLSLPRKAGPAWWVGESPVPSENAGVCAHDLG